VDAVDEMREEPGLGKLNGGRNKYGVGRCVKSIAYASVWH